MLYQRTLQRRWSTHNSEVLFPLPSDAASPLRWRISLVNEASSHLLTDSNTSPCYYIYSYTSPWLGKLFVIPLSATPKINSTTDAYNSDHQNKIFINMWCYRSPKWLSTSLQSKQRKMQQTMQCVSSNTAICGGGVTQSHSDIFCYLWILNCRSHVYSNTVHWDTTLKEHSHACLHMSSIFYL